MSDFGGEQVGGGGAGPPAGWYPVDGGQQRYWDGVQWTDHMAPLAPPVDSDAPAPAIARDSGFEPMPFGSPAGPVPAVTSDDRTMAVLAHVLAIVVGFLGPLIIWLIKKDESAFVGYHGKEALNFQITLFIAWIVAFIALLVLVGLLLIPVLMILQLVMPIVAAVAANKGEMYRYPFTIRLIS